MNIQIELSQKQTMSPQMLQSIRILQMSSHELNHYLEELSMENPVVELEPQSTAVSEEETYEQQFRLQQTSDWLISTDRQNKAYYEDDTENGEEYWQDAREKGEMLNDYLHSQILTKKYTNLERKLLDFLIESLDSHGYLTEDAQSMATLFAVPQSLTQRMIRELQSLEPSGIGASSLTQCLLLQIDRLEKDGNLPPDIPADRIRDIIRLHLKDIGQNHLHRVMHTMNLSRNEIERCCILLKSLTPRPANAFATREYIQYVIPDAFIIYLGDHPQVLMNESGCHRFHPNSFYVSMKEETQDPQLKQYLQEKIRQIHSVEKDVRQRISTVCKVIHVLVNRQDAFFRHGPGNRLPLGLKDIAAKLELHESTISRAMQDKYLQCKWGIFPLNYFLSSAAFSTSMGDVGETREDIEHKIRALIIQENKKKPLSDQAIADRLSQNGTDISRRTVNKYRSEMGIPDKSGRKA